MVASAGSMVGVDEVLMPPPSTGTKSMMDSPTKMVKSLHLSSPSSVDPVTPSTSLSSSSSSSSSSSITTRNRTRTVSSAARIPLPSPSSRPRMNPHFAARLARIAPTQGRSTTSTTHNHGAAGLVLPPPSIHRDAAASIFRPTSILRPDVPSGSFWDQTPKRTTTTTVRSKSVSSFGSLSSSSPRHSVTDRYIPSRATSNLNLSLWEHMASPRRVVNSSSSSMADATEEADVSARRADEATSTVSRGTAGDTSTSASPSSSVAATAGDASSSQPSPLHLLLRSELLGENLDPLQATNPAAASLRSSASSTTPLREGGGNTFSFQSPRQAFLTGAPHFNSASNSLSQFSLTPVQSPSSQRLLQGTPQKQKRRIAKVPFKVLDAPALQDDFYLNLVDWSCQNVLAVGLGSCVYLWSACTSKVTKLCDLAGAEDTVTSVSWAQRGTHLAVGTNKGDVQLWDTVTCNKVRTMTGHSARIGSLSWSGPTLSSGSRDRLIFLRDVRCASQYTHRLCSHKQEVCGLKWSFEEPALLASGGNDNRLLVWDIKGSSTLPLHKFSQHTAAVKAIAWSPHQHGLLASGGGTADRCIRFWNTLSGVGLSCVDTGSQVCNLAWSRNCNELVSTHGYSLNQIVVWRYPTMSKVVTLTGHTYRVLYLAMSPDGSTIVTGAGDETLRFWQVFPGPRSSHNKTVSEGLLFPAMPGSVVR